MCIQHAPDTVKNLYKLADEIERCWAMDMSLEETVPIVDAIVEQDSSFAELVKWCTNSLLGIVTLKPVDLGRGHIKSQAVEIDEDAIVHSVFDIGGEKRR